MNESRLVQPSPFHAASPRLESDIIARVAALADHPELSREAVDAVYSELPPEEVNAPTPLVVKALVDLGALAYHTLPGRPWHPVGAVAVNAARRLGDRALLRRALSVAAALTPSRSVAFLLLAEALLLARELRDTSAEAAVCLNMGGILQMLGHDLAGERLQRHVLSLPRVDTDLKRQALSNTMSTLLVHPSDSRRIRAAIEAAEEFPIRFEQSDPILAMAERAIEHAFHCNLASLNADAGDLQAARKHLDLATASVPTLYPSMSCALEAATAAVLIAEGNTEAGLGAMRRALATAKEQSPTDVHYVYNRAIRAYEDAGRPDRALTILWELVSVTQATQEDALFCEQTVAALDIVEAPTCHERHDADLTSMAAQLERVVSERWRSIARTSINADIAAGHDARRSFRLRSLARHFARSMGWTEERTRSLGIAAQFANIGMIGLPSSLLLKTTALSEGERALLANHCQFGERLLNRAGLDALDVAAIVAKQHHEWWNGHGYPGGLAEEGIAEEARIVSLCDALDAMIHASLRNQSPITLDDACSEILLKAGSQFDPSLARSFVFFVRGQLGSLIDLDDFLGHDADADAYVQARDMVQRLVGGPA